MAHVVNRPDSISGYSIWDSVVNQGHFTFSLPVIILLVSHKHVTILVNTCHLSAALVKVLRRLLAIATAARSSVGKKLNFQSYQSPLPPKIISEQLKILQVWYSTRLKS
jgi:hypothetical protein